MAPHPQPTSIKLIVLYGPESTGKSTLARRLAGHYQTQFVPEFARDYIDERGNQFGYDDMAPIALGQRQLEDVAVKTANAVLFCDTDAITTLIYSRHYFGKCPPLVEQLADERRYDLYLLLDIDLPWEADPQRDLPHRRQEFYTLFRNELESRRIPFIAIDGLGETRLQNAIRSVDGFLQTAPS